MIDVNQLKTLDMADPRVAELLKLLEAETNYRDTHKLFFYRPYPKQQLFHDFGSDKRFRQFRAANRIGKTRAGSYEVAMHLTGIYPDWWKGYRFSKANIWWVCGESGESVRDTIQKELLGPLAELGTGALPKDYQDKAVIGKISMARGVPDMVDTVQVRHVSGKWSYCYFKTYGKDVDAWMGATIDGIWFDEEPPMTLFQEGVTRTHTNSGPVIHTFTPLKGYSDVVRYFEENKENRVVINMTLDDVPEWGHLTKKQKEEIESSYLPHERDARARGLPLLGSGAVFPLPEADITCEPFNIPEDWPRIVGVDFGWGEHPTAACWFAYDQLNDTLYLYGCYRKKGAGIADHASAIRARGDFPVAWPHDGLMHDKQSPVRVKDLYAKEGLDMLHEHATHEREGGYGLEAGVTEMFERFKGGRLKVFSTCYEFFAEYRMYYRKNGKIVTNEDDVLSAARYGMMMRRFARRARNPFFTEVEYPDLGFV